MRRLIALASVCLMLQGCVSLGTEINPAEGVLASFTVSAEDCISTGNLAGRIIAGIPMIGGKILAQFGCPVELPTPL